MVVARAAGAGIMGAGQWYTVSVQDEKFWRLAVLHCASNEYCDAHLKIKRVELNVLCLYLNKTQMFSKRKKRLR